MNDEDYVVVYADSPEEAMIKLRDAGLEPVKAEPFDAHPRRSSAIARASFARSRQCLGSLIRDADVRASRQAATASCWRAASQASNTSTISPVAQRRLVIRPPSRALSAASTAPLELRLCLASFRGMMDFVFKPPLRLARDVTVRTLDDAAEFARTYVGPRLPHRRDRVVHRLEEISDGA